MIEITPLAAEKLTASLSENNIDSAVRIAAMNGSGGPSLGLALDEQGVGPYPCRRQNHPGDRPGIVADLRRGEG